jgi:hypothetical protein
MQAMLALLSTHTIKGIPRGYQALVDACTAVMMQIEAGEIDIDVPRGYDRILPGVVAVDAMRFHPTGDFSARAFASLFGTILVAKELAAARAQATYLSFFDSQMDEHRAKAKKKK